MAAVVLGAAIAIVFGAGVAAPFLLDDTNCIVFNPSIQHLWPLIGSAGTPGPLNPPAELSTSGRPLVNLSFAVNYWWGGLNPRGYHMVNFLLHGASALLLFEIVRRTLRLAHFAGRFSPHADLISLGVALLWAIHPLQTEAVVYITQRTELAVGLCYLATLYSAQRYWDAPVLKQRLVWALLATTACSAGMASKEVMATAPLLLLLFERTFIASSFRNALRSSWPLYLALSTTWALLLALNYGGPRASTAGFHVGISPWTWWFTQAEVLAMYLKLVIWPWPLVIHYEMPYVESLAAAWPWLLLAAALAIASIVMFWRRASAGFVGAGIFLLLAPTLIVPIATEMAAERRMYLPLALLCSLAIAGAWYLLSIAQARHAAGERETHAPAPLLVATLGIAVVLLACGAVSARRVAVYRQPLLLWQDTVKNMPCSPLARMNYGLELLNAGRIPEAISQYEEALRLEPAREATHRNNLGYALLRGGDTNGAIEQFVAAAGADPQSVEVHNNLGTALLTAGRPHDAVPQFETVLRLQPGYLAGHLNLGNALDADHRSQEAILHFEQYVAAQPDSVDGWLYLARARANLGDLAGAEVAGRRALELALKTGQGEQIRQIEAWLRQLAPRPTTP